MDGAIIVINKAIEIAEAIFSSSLFVALKIFLAVYLIVIFIDIILLLMLRGLGRDYTIIKTGVRNVPTESKGKMMKRWNSVKMRLESGDVSQFKVAILEADKIADDMLEKIGYEGKNMGERLAEVQPGQMENTEELQKAHEVRNKIVYEKDFVVNKKLAEETIGIYEKFLKNLEFI